MAINIQTLNVNCAPSNQEQFEALLAAGNVAEARSMMDDRSTLCRAALAEYDVAQHKVMRRPRKLIKNRNGETVDAQEQWKLPIPYQVYINEVALVFLFGQPVRWQQVSADADRAFAAFQQVMKDIHFDAKIRQCKRLAGAETECAMLFHLYQDDDGRAKLQLRVLAHSRGDEIYTRFDQYDNLISFAWGYYLKQSDDNSEYHLDVYTKETIFLCTQRATGWDVEQYPNEVKKIPVILFRQEKEWAGVEHLIHRDESNTSRSADTIDYFSDPILELSADIVKNLPEKEGVGKTLLIKGDDANINNAAKYLTWDSAPQSKENEQTRLRELILTMTFTPDIRLDTLRSLGNLSGKALRTVLLLADIKANKRKEVYDEMLDRTASLITTIIGNVLDVRLKGQCDALRIAHVWQEPFGEDVASTLESIVKATDGGILSQESAIELNPLVQDSITEKRRLADEGDTRQQQQDNLFGAAAGRAVV